jgi:hypothetical protein
MERYMKALNLAATLCAALTLTAASAACAQVGQPQPPASPDVGVTPPPPPPPLVANPNSIQGNIAGVVKRYLINPEGDVDGMMLTDNTLVMFPPHLGTQVTASVATGARVRIVGDTTPAGTVRAQQIINDQTGQVIADQPQPLRLPRELRGAGLVKLEASGSILRVMTAPRGEPDGVLLADGTVVKLTPPVASQFASLLQPGTVVAAQGYGTRNRYGESLQATAFGTPGNLTSLYNPQPQ